ncbi:hypothetical protein O0L34_g18663 [Tuta absoluta]|nr:hypothetical protein O0L34_g18663 [Tuta absoluta]
MAPRRLADDTINEELSFISDILDNIPATNKYEVLKERLLKAFQESSEQQFHKLVKEMDLGQQRPSQLLRRMQELARNTGVGDDPLKNLWLSRLPPAVRAVLAVSPQDTKIEKLAEMADKITKTLNSGEIAAVAFSSSVGAEVNLALLAEMKNLSVELRNLRGEVNEIRGRQQHRSQHFQRNRSKSRRARSKSAGGRTPTPGRTPSSPDWLCRQHYRYRERARFCEAPCNWNANQGN